MFDEQINQIMSSIYMNASHNIEQNEQWILDEDIALNFAEQYLHDYSSIIAENINNIKDKQQLLLALDEDIIETAWVLEVLLHYRDELRRNIELETNEDVQELIHQTDTTDD